MIEKDNNQDFIDAMTNEVRQSVDALDASTISSLNRIRTQALESKPGLKTQWWYIPVGAMVTASLIVLAYNLLDYQNIDTMMTGQDVEMITTLDSIELYEDLEFYEWLDDYELSG